VVLVDEATELPPEYMTSSDQADAEAAEEFERATH
jgi:hypothetical protein